MRTYTEEKTAYKFEELSQSAKDRAVQGYRENEMHDGWWDCVYEDYTQKCNAAGFNDPGFRFSGFWSQGDGASFSCSFCFTGDDALQFLTSEQEQKYKALQVAARFSGMGQPPELSFSGSITSRDNHYCHAYCMRVSSDYETWVSAEFQPDSVEEAIAEFDALIGDEPFEAILEAARDMANDLYRDLEKEYEYLTSEETVAEMSKANEREYDEHGKLI
jgi:hypothetical protein